MRVRATARARLCAFPSRNSQPTRPLGRTQATSAAHRAAQIAESRPRGRGASLSKNQKRGSRVAWGCGSLEKVSFMSENTIVISVDAGETRIALIENGILSEIIVERDRDKSPV